MAFLAAWTGVFVVHSMTDDVTAFTIAVTIAAFATEALIWVAAFIGGWTIFANRKAFWTKMTGSSKAETETE